MDFEQELKKFELSSVFTINFSWLKQYVESSNGIYTTIRNISDDDFREIESSFYALQAAWKAWREAKAQAVPEPVLDAPACVGAGTFQKGVKWSTVIGAAQRHFKYTQNAKKAPSLDIVQVKKLVSGDFVLVPKVATKQMVSAGYEAHDGFFTNGQVQDVYQAMIEAQEPAND